MILIIEIISFLLILAAAIWVAFVYLFTRRLFYLFLRGEAPFVPSNIKKASGIAEALDIGAQDVFYELGSGDARILVACHEAQPQAKYIGFEKDIIPYLWSKLRLWRMGLLAKIKIYHKDFFNEDLSQATHLFTYLGPKQMEKLEKKFEQELKSGSRLVSLKFKLPNKLPLQENKCKSEEIFVYEY